MKSESHLSVKPSQHTVGEEVTISRKRPAGSADAHCIQASRELHDGPMQDLYSLIYRIEELRGHTDAETGDKLKSVNEDLQNVIQKLRRTASDLHSPTLANFGLEKAIKSYAREFRLRHSALLLHLSLVEDREALPERVRMALFDVFQHALKNVVQHARASKTWVHFFMNEEDALLEVIDNGMGFTVPENWLEVLARSGNSSLAGISERIRALGGVFTVESQPGRSTSIRAVIPLKDPCG